MEDLQKSIREHNREIIRLNDFLNDMLLVFSLVALLGLASVAYMVYTV